MVIMEIVIHEYDLLRVSTSPLKLIKCIQYLKKDEQGICFEIGAAIPAINGDNGNWDL